MMLAALALTTLFVVWPAMTYLADVVRYLKARWRL